MTGNTGKGEDDADEDEDDAGEVLEDRKGEMDRDWLGRQPRAAEK